jgi:tight adherence protein C
VTRLVVIYGLALWAGATLLLSQLRWFSRPSLAERLRPYTFGLPQSEPKAGLLSIDSFGDVVGPAARNLGERLARAFGVSEALAVRLERIHSPVDITSFRLRQLGWATAAFASGTIATVLIRPPLAVGLLLALGLPLLAFLVVEQQLAAASTAWQRRLFLELPVVSEQLAMLLSSGYSLGAALNRLAARGRGACARDLGRVCGRIRQGLSEVDALREWADVAGVPAINRLVPVLALNREAADLGRLVSEEARAIRRDVHRQLIETMERRGQQVWVPVTVATLVPGVIFLSIPFIQALKLFSGS